MTQRENFMRKASILTTLIAALIFFTMATAATAARPGCKPKDCPPDTTTTTSEATLWTCQARIDNGANAWDADGDGQPNVEWDAMLGAYRASGLPLCFDVVAEHRDVTSWTVTWAGTSARATKHGAEALLVFEEQIHENPYANSVISLPSGTTSGSDTWEPTLGFDGDDPRNLAFVAMPRRGTAWTSFSVTIKPLLTP